MGVLIFQEKQNYSNGNSVNTFVINLDSVKYAKLNEETTGNAPERYSSNITVYFFDKGQLNFNIENSEGEDKSAHIIGRNEYRKLIEAIKSDEDVVINYSDFSLEEEEISEPETGEDETSDNDEETEDGE